MKLMSHGDIFAHGLFVNFNPPETLYAAQICRINSSMTNCWNKGLSPEPFRQLAISYCLQYKAVSFQDSEVLHHRIIFEDRLSNGRAAHPEFI